MRRLALIITCCVCCQVLAPARADAWWGWLDQLSGAGPWKGYQIEFRLICFSESGKATPAPFLGFESSCPLDNGQKPRASISIASRFFHADPDPGYANNKEIKLLTLQPAFSFSVFPES